MQQWHTSCGTRSGIRSASCSFCSSCCCLWSCGSGHYIAAATGHPTHGTYASHNRSFRSSCIISPSASTFRNHAARQLTNAAITNAGSTTRQRWGPRITITGSSATTANNHAIWTIREWWDGADPRGCQWGFQGALPPRVAQGHCASQGIQPHPWDTHLEPSSVAPGMHAPLRICPASIRLKSHMRIGRLPACLQTL